MVLDKGSKKTKVCLFGKRGYECFWNPKDPPSKTSIFKIKNFEKKKGNQGFLVGRKA